MRGLESVRTELCALLAAPCAVQRDRTGRALFYSDYPRRGVADAARRLAQAGYTAAEGGGAAFIDMAPGRAAAFLASLPQPPLPVFDDARALLFSTARMLRACAAPGPCPLFPVRRALLMWDAGRTGELALLLQQAVSDALRQGYALPAGLDKLLFTP